MREELVKLAIQMASAAAIFVVGAIVIYAFTRILRKAIGAVDHLDTTIAKFIISIANKFAWGVLIIVVLGKLGVDIAPLVAGVGGLAFVVSFACQDSLSNLAAGIMIALNRPYRVGDFVAAGGQEGTILELNMMATIMSTGDNRRIVIPNKVVWGNPIVNYSAAGTRRVDMEIGVAYGADLEAAKAAIRAALAKVPTILAEPVPTIEVESLGDSEVVLVVRPWVKSADYWPTKFAATQRIKEELDADHIEIPFPQMEVHVNTKQKGMK